MKRIGEIFTVFCLVFSVLMLQPALAEKSISIRDQAIEISKELRDPEAVNQSLYESELPNAAKLKARIYQMLQVGESKQRVLNYFSERYGEKILYTPTVKPSTIALWLFPLFLILLAFLWACYRLLKIKRKTS